MRHFNKGFTLIELMITVVIVAVVLGLAVPSFQTQLLNNRSLALGEDFATAINFVRSEAVKRATRVSLCASSDGATCAGEWTDGFIAFVDTAVTDKAAAPIVGTVLREWDEQDPNAVITAESNGTAVTFIRYTSLGTLARVNDKPLEINTELKKCSGNAARKITIGLSGLVGIEKAECTVI
jgi:type IV fimbrial biogenesis protein FimT